MKFKNTLFAILAIFCVIVSAGAVSATHTADYTSPYYLDGSYDGHNGQIIPPDANHDEAQYAAGGDQNVNSTSTGHNGTVAPSNITNNTSTIHSNGNATNVSTNSTNTTASQNMPATGNPIIALLIVGSLVGSYAVIKRD